MKTYPNEAACPTNHQTGETKREKMARSAMTGLLSSDTAQEIPPTTVVRMAVELADKLIEELNR